MDFDFTPEQHALREMARDLFGKESPPDRLRAAWEKGERDDTVWRKMAEVGLCGLTVPEEHGGMGGDEIDLVGVLEEAGRAALPEPLLETVAVGAPLLAEAGTEEQRSQWLPRIAAGEAVVTVRLAGAPYVVDADIADLVLWEEGGVLHAVPREGVRVHRVPSVDGARRLFHVVVETSEATRMSGGGDAARRAYLRAAAAAAAVLSGVSMRLLEESLAYAKERQQFGRPIGSFQAVKHKLASMHVLLEEARPAGWYAAYAIARDLPDRDEAARVAKAAAAEAGAYVNGEALQVHGGIGFTWEHDLHLWLKRGKALEAAYGSAREHRAVLADVLFEAP